MSVCTVWWGDYIFLFCSFGCLVTLAGIYNIHLTIYTSDRCTLHTVPCSSFLAMCPCPVTSRVSHNLSGGQLDAKSSSMITEFCANFCVYDSAFFFFVSVISSLSTSIGKSCLGSRYCQRKEQLVRITLQPFMWSSYSGMSSGFSRSS